MRTAPCRRHRHITAAVVLLLCLLLAAADVFADDSAARGDGATELQLPVGVAVGSATYHRCGFDELVAHSQSARVMGISRVAQPEAYERSGGVSKVILWSPNATYWTLMRILLVTEDVNNASRYCTAVGQTRPNFQGDTVMCTSEDILTEAKRKVLTESLVPAAIKLHEDRLQVVRAKGSMVVDAAAMASDDICGQFTIPASHTTTGVSDADFVLYMSAVPTEGNTIAWATTCQQFADGRPSVGVLNVAPKYISADPHTVRVIAHEILHALGFSYHFFEKHGMTSSADLRGKGPFPVLSSSNVVAKAQIQYGCPGQAFMELEDQGSNGTAYSHWKMRSAKDELMAGTIGVGRYTALTIAAMEDLGFYKGNYANAEPMSYGQNAGCALTTTKCVVNGVSQFSSMFCADDSKSLRCTSDHTGMGLCAMGQHETALPSYFQYFSDPSSGGDNVLMDYCPYIQGYSNMSCRSDNGVLLGNTYRNHSSCFNVPHGFVTGGKYIPTQRAICAEVLCLFNMYKIKVMGASKYTPCRPGELKSLSSLSSSFAAGYFTCPSYDEVCTGHMNAAHYRAYASLTALLLSLFSVLWFL